MIKQFFDLLLSLFSPKSPTNTSTNNPSSESLPVRRIDVAPFKSSTGEGSSVPPGSLPGATELLSLTKDSLEASNGGSSKTSAAVATASEVITVKVDKGGSASIPASLLASAGGFVHGVVDVHIHPNSLTIRSGSHGHSNELNVYPDGRIRISARILRQIGVQPGQSLNIRSFHGKLVVSKVR